MLRCAVLASVLLTSPTAFADEPDDGYGTHVLAADLVTTGALLAGMRWAPALYLAGGSYLLGGPIVHVAHERYERAGFSLGLRIGLPVLGLLAGDLIHQAMNSGDPHVWEAFDGPPSPWWVLGASAGFVSAIVIDQRKVSGGYTRRQTVIVPTATATTGGATFGVAAMF
jgi:hypothetical protein